MLSERDRSLAEPLDPGKATVARQEMTSCHSGSHETKPAPRKPGVVLLPAALAQRAVATGGRRYLWSSGRGATVLTAWANVDTGRKLGWSL